MKSTRTIPSEIKFIAQPTQRTCVSACIAMILDEDVNVIIEEFHEKYFNNEIKIGDYSTSKGLVVSVGTSEQTISFDRIYLLCVPSLNYKAINHEILLDTRNDFVTLIDPQQENKNKNHYVYGIDTKDLKPNQYNLRCHSVDYEIMV